VKKVKKKFKISLPCLFKRKSREKAHTPEKYCVGRGRIALRGGQRTEGPPGMKVEAEEVKRTVCHQISGIFCLH